MAWLLQNRGYAEHDERMGQMAAPPLSDVHLEAVEEAENESPELDETRTLRMACAGGCLFPESLLEKRQTCKCTGGNLQQKTRTGGTC